MTSEGWRFVPKHEIWFLVAVFVGLVIAHELSGDSLTWAKLGILVGVTAMVLRRDAFNMEEGRTGRG